MAFTKFAVSANTRRKAGAGRLTDDRLLQRKQPEGGGNVARINRGWIDRAWLCG